MAPLTDAATLRASDDERPANLDRDDPESPL
jgi:hypothetical protein